MKLWQIGLLIVIFGGLLNAILIQNNIGGLVRELMRLVILTGFGILIVSAFKVVAKPKPKGK